VGEVGLADPDQCVEPPLGERFRGSVIHRGQGRDDRLLDDRQLLDRDLGPHDTEALVVDAHRQRPQLLAARRVGERDGGRPHEPLELRSRRRAGELHQVAFVLARRDADDGAHLRVRQLATTERRCDPRQRSKRVGDPDLLTGR